MNARAVATPFAWLALAGVLGSSVGAVAEDYGIAGGPVGADRIAKISQTIVTTSLTDKPDVSKWYGNAGGPVGADAIAYVSQTTVSIFKADFSEWYGRAGGPVGLAAVKRGSPSVARVKP